MRKDRAITRRPDHMYEPPESKAIEPLLPRSSGSNSVTARSSTAATNEGSTEGEPRSPSGGASPRSNLMRIAGLDRPKELRSIK